MGLKRSFCTIAGFGIQWKMRVHLKAVDQFGSEVLGVGGRTAIAADQNFSALAKPFSAPFGGLDDARSRGRQCALLGLNTGGKVLFDALEKQHE